MSPKKLEKQFTAGFDEYNDAIYRHCYFRVFDKDLAQELTQETYMKTWRYMSRGNEVTNMRAFLYRTATNLVIDHSRKKKEASLDTMQEKGFEPSMEMEEELNLKIDLEKLIELTKQMNDTSREVFLLRYVDEFSPKEIAEMLGETANVISVRIHRSLAAFRKLAQDQKI